MIHLVVVVENTAALLAAEAYGAGALLRWESAATVDGTYTEGGTEALVSGTSLYDIWDSAGTAATWYRTRISNAGGTTFSAYSSSMQPPAPPLITISELQFRMKRTFAAGAETDQVDTFIDDASALVRLVAEKDFYDPVTGAETTPPAIKAVLAAMIRRALDVPVGASAGLSGETFPAYSWSGGGGGGEGGQPAASIYATRREKGIIRQAAGVMPVASIAIASEVDQYDDAEEEVVI